jgi:hypothetical protein
VDTILLNFLTKNINILRVGLSKKIISVFINFSTTEYDNNNMCILFY